MRGVTSFLVVVMAAVGAFAAAVPAPETASVEAAEVAAVGASEVADHVEVARAGVTALSASTLAAFAPFTQLARAAYCPSSKVTGWACGGTLPSPTIPDFSR